MGLARLLLAGALVLGCLSGTASAQQAPRPLSSDLLAVSAWGQRLAVAQQPLIDVYSRCRPVNEAAAAAFNTVSNDADSVREILPKFVECVEHFEAAAIQVSTKLADVGNLPRSAEIALNIRSAELLERSAASAKASAASMRDLLTAIELAAANDADGARKAYVRARSGSAGALDAQILLLEVMAKGAPIEWQRAVLDMRILVNRAIRTLLVSESTSQGIVLGDALSSFGRPARDAARRIRTGWTSASAESRRVIERLGDAKRKAMMVRMDAIYGDLGTQADATASVLERAPVGTASFAEMQRFSDEVLKFEIFVAQTAALVSNIVQEHR